MDKTIQHVGDVFRDSGDLLADAIQLARLLEAGNASTGLQARLLDVGESVVKVREAIKEARRQCAIAISMTATQLDRGAHD